MARETLKLDLKTRGTYPAAHGGEEEWLRKRETIPHTFVPKAPNSSGTMRLDHLYRSPDSSDRVFVDVEAMRAAPAPYEDIDPTPTPRVMVCAERLRDSTPWLDGPPSVAPASGPQDYGPQRPSEAPIVEVRTVYVFPKVWQIVVAALGFSILGAAMDWGARIMVVREVPHQGAP